MRAIRIRILRRTRCVSAWIASGSGSGAGRKIRRRLFLHEKDPLNIIVDEYRSGRGARQTKFFGSGVAKCKH